MMVIFVSQCEKKALARTRRVLDAFADRIGDNTWQTVITEEGLDTVKKLLRKTASKSTAVSCHWIRSRARSNLLWVVGRKDAFDYRGVVAVNCTRRNILHSEWENDWHYASSIQIIATIAALLHDIGKSTIGFQNKLIQRPKYGDAYRHEWISLRLFELLTDGCDSDDAWLNRLANLPDWLAVNNLDDALDANNLHKTNIAALPPLAQWVAWLIVTHHRLPPDGNGEVFYKRKQRQHLLTDRLSLGKSLPNFYKTLQPVDYWVKNPKTIDEHPQSISEFCNFRQLVVHSHVWQKQVKRWANKALNDTALMQLSLSAVQGKCSVDDTFILYLSRLALMVGDHNYSSLDDSDKRRVTGANDLQTLAANTDRKTGKTKQALDEHLLGVASFTAAFARHLPKLTYAAAKLPTLRQHDALVKPTDIERFKWQNHACKLAQDVRQDTEMHGFFGVNMASTGCGKTIGNARIMYGLADPIKGARFTIALGLRVLTLQTGLSFREDLQLSEDQLAILVGGTANKKLFEYHYQSTSLDAEMTGISGEYDKVDEYPPAYGSESSEGLIDEEVHFGAFDSIDYQDYAGLNIDTILNDRKARDLLFSPIVTCTVDHVIQASECRRGGCYIAPTLRLLSSDLILDEPDDFDQNDLPALARLVHLAGLFGSRVLLSSATLTPDLIAGLYRAYVAGRRLFNQSQNRPTPNVVCAWFDEQPKAIISQACADIDAFMTAHDAFVKKRVQYLAKQPVRRCADILPITASYHTEHKDAFYSDLGQSLLHGALTLHENHHLTHPKSGKRVSLGLVRIANIQQIIHIAKQLLTHANVPADVHVHLSCYHAKQLLVLRNHLETRLDRILKRNECAPDGIFEHKEIATALAQSDAKNHLFMVLATPVAEVGRDHDYDWAIVEPSSMRSIIQLAGRVWRHRPKKIAAQPNLLLMQYNLRYLRFGSNQPVFIRPGFETQKFRLHTYDVSELIPQEVRNCIDARPRIDVQNTRQPTQDDGKLKTLSQLEHRVMAHVLNPIKTNHVSAYWSDVATAHRATTHLQQLTPFRDSSLSPQEDWILIPNDTSDSTVDSGFDAFYAEDIYANGINGATTQNKAVTHKKYEFSHPQVTPWLAATLVDALHEIQAHESELNINGLAVRYATVSLDCMGLLNSRGWWFNEFLGFVRK